MTITCDSCHKRYSIADDKVRGRSVKIRCRQCQAIIPVDGTQLLSEDDDRTKAVPLLDPSVVWFAMVKGQQVGPLDLKHLESKVRASEIGLRTYLWREGMPDWKRAADLPELARLFAGVSVESVVKTTAAAPSGAAAGVAEAKAAASAGTGEGARRKTTQIKRAEPMQDVAVGAQAPAPGVAKPKNGNHDSLGELFSDADLPESAQTLDEPSPGGQAAAGEGKKIGKAKSRDEDPFAALGELDPSKLPPPGEATAFFIVQAGVNKRNPPWKIALAIAGFVLVPVGLLYLLSELKIVPLQVTRVDEKGEIVEEPIFSAGGMEGLGDILSGKAKKKKEEAARRRAALAGRQKPPGDESVEDGPRPGEPTAEQIAELYRDDPKKTTEPKVREVDTPVLNAAGLSKEKVDRVVRLHATTFQSCVNEELRRNPSFKSRTVTMNVTVGSSGIVKDARVGLAGPLGECLTSGMRRITFPSFEGYEDANLEIPLNLTATL